MSSFIIFSVLSVECYSCWPPMPEEDCKRSGKRMQCRDWEHIGYDSCIEVEYTGNDTLARACYPSYKCEGAREWCRRYGPCTVKCCQYNLCNPASTFKIVGTFSLFMALAAVFYNLGWLCELVVGNDFRMTVSWETVHMQIIVNCLVFPTNHISFEMITIYPILNQRLN